ncbi:riboflavin synthase [Corynebacterium sanguinis]|uniref:Riboflavin synthase n=1 Tax=Corynebacterium sanguinis TaxID=2594913 RepID=A0A6C1TZE6_9CORY|nr:MULTISPECIES: riboflavin synthase [Corynebacterium]MBA4505591.1 riboflavin synthase [Corynebacterium sanguinis]MCT1411131.1 riboflavin synthase [Corynebacterium sanguinis]MCT1413490.1 riboflavin synthase [Corynebacterium sanguinis]MCT1554458.1 riboflavin synthase [Corynebacterium sanguinis]MCT1584146.1 riboflavin synthase [Corynebacterium sanguinis]
MFTGLVEEVGEVVALTKLDDAVRIAVRAPLVTADARHGDSIAVDGVCLTVVDNADGVFSADVMQETLDRSRLGSYVAGSRVNLERALAAGARMGGHIVQGHVDGVAQVVSRTPSENWEVVRITLPAGLARYVVEKGSITVNGTSLTVSAIGEDYFEVSLIPTTLSDTTAGSLATGEDVNIEVDIVAKYVEKMTQGYH